MIKKLSGEFDLLFDFKNLCAMFLAPFVSSYLENLELGVLAKEMVKLETLTSNQWKMIKTTASLNKVHAKDDGLQQQPEPRAQLWKNLASGNSEDLTSFRSDGKPHLHHFLFYVTRGRMPRYNLLRNYC